MRTLMVFVLSLLTGFVYSQNGYSVSSYKVTIKGTSNLHDWESAVNEVRVNADLGMADGELLGINSLKVTMPVRSIKSTKGSIMDNKTYDALKASSNPNISFTMSGVSSFKKSGSGYDVSVKGTLSIAGASKTVQLNAFGKMADGGKITFSGSEKIKMTDYKIKPPTALLGTMTVGDDVEVVYLVTLKQN